MSIQSLAADLMADARRYVSKNFGNMDATDLPTDAVRAAIEHLYEGGWHAYEADFMRVMRTLAPKSEEMSPIKLKARVQHLTRRRLREHDEIVSATFEDLEIKIVLSIASVEYKSRRDVVTGRRLELHWFRRDSTEAGWTHSLIHVEDATREELVRFGAINTPERDEAKREQFETCHRPGTDKTPLQGWIARAEMSHKQAHETEIFQKPSK